MPLPYLLAILVGLIPVAVVVNLALDEYLYQRALRRLKKEIRGKG